MNIVERCLIDDGTMAISTSNVFGTIKEQMKDFGFINILDEKLNAKKTVRTETKLRTMDAQTSANFLKIIFVLPMLRTLFPGSRGARESDNLSPVPWMKSVF